MTTKHVKITLDEFPFKAVSDGERDRKHGEICELPEDVADLLVSKRMAVFVDGSSAIKAREDAKDVAARQAIATQQQIAKAAMSVHDNLPPEVRADVHERGDEAIEDYLLEQQREHLTAYETPKRRGRKKWKED